MLDSTAAKREFLLLIIPLLIVEFVRGAFIISYVPDLSVRNYGISIAVVGLAVSIHFISDAITNLVIGYVIKRIGTKRVIQYSFLISTIGLVLVCIWMNNFTVLLGSLLLGIGICPLWLVMLTKASGDKRGQNMSLVYLGWLGGLGAGTILMNYLLEFNKFPILWLLPSLMVVGWIIFNIVIRDEIDPHQTSLKLQWHATIELLKKSRPVIPGTLLQGISMGMLIPILPSFIIKQMGLSHTEYSLLLLLGGGIAVGFLVPMGKVADNANKIAMVVLGFGVSGTALYLLATSKSFGATLLYIILLGLFFAVVLPAWNAFIAGFIPESLKEASWGIFSALQGVGVMIGPTLGSLLALQNKAAGTIQISALIFVGIAIFYLGYYVFGKVKHRSVSH
ncbi:MFS transporter [Metabacillus sp. GX 13764]|uniref:MFS transporter n=1 Tax=Metabacillus kandeliae TaxID=2900151 RepID=UPI001E50999F|nr:MFS transporter [Metabacillus kandeliae]MCD7036016.1 MFS transporter [Metabacillus kandeliae]